MAQLKESAHQTETYPSPSPLPSPAGRGNSEWTLLAWRTANQQIPTQVFDEDGERFSLSQRERAGVRENTPPIHDRSETELPHVGKVDCEMNRALRHLHKRFFIPLIDFPAQAFIVRGFEAEQ